METDRSGEFVDSQGVSDQSSGSSYYQSEMSHSDHDQPSKSTSMFSSVSSNKSSTRGDILNLSEDRLAYTSWGPSGLPQSSGSSLQSPSQWLAPPYSSPVWTPSTPPTAPSPDSEVHPLKGLRNKRWSRDSWASLTSSGYGSGESLPGSSENLGAARGFRKEISNKTDGLSPDTKPNEVEEHISPRLEQQMIQTMAGATCELRFPRGQESVASILKAAICKSPSLKELHIEEIPDECVQALGAFILKEKRTKSIRATMINGKSWLEVIKRNDNVRIKYCVTNDNARFQHVASYLREELADFLNENGISSAVRTKNNKLSLFMTKEDEVATAAPLSQRIQEIRDLYGPIADEFEICPLEHELEIHNQTGEGSFYPGSSILFECKDDRLHATLGALVDDGDNMYALSSSHGKKALHCYFTEDSDEGSSEVYEAKYIGEFCSKDPLLDACLIEIDDKRLKERMSPILQGIERNTALYGPYNGPGEELEEIAVMKAGAATNLTTGVLSHYDFNLQSQGIHGALIIVPKDGCPSFTGDADSGAVIFREASEGCNGSCIRQHEALAMHSIAIKGFKGSHDTCSLAFRLDTLFEAIEKKLGRKISFLPIFTTDPTKSNAVHKDKCV